MTRYGRLIIVAEAPRHRQPSGATVRCVHVRCDCGTEKTVTFPSLRSGNTLSCGCLRLEIVTKHGQWRSATYKRWHDMRQRCAGTTAYMKRHYADRGIMVCARWDSYENFLADMGECPPGLSLDRIDNDGNYEPGNCRWATHGEQRRNTSRNIWITMPDGQRLCLKDACAIIGIDPSAMAKKAKRKGVTTQEVFNGQMAALSPVRPPIIRPPGQIPFRSVTGGRTQ